jgi:predicted RNA methylase
MSKKHMYLSVNFSKESKKNTVDKIIKIKITKDGKINGIKITNLSYFPDKTTLGSTAAYCMPLILPIEEKRVNKNQIVSINLEYELCGGMENCKYFIDY